MSRPQTPIPEPTRPLVRFLRLSIIPVGILASISAVLAVVVGLPGLAVVIGVTVGLFAASMWLIPRSYSTLPAAAGIGLITWYVRDLVPTGLLLWIVGLAVASLVVSVFGWERVPRSLIPESIERAPDDATGKGAERFSSEFEELGYRQVGALSFRVMRFDVIESIMIGPNRDRFAQVTDSVITVVSHFGDKSLLTRNSGLTGVPPSVLTNDLRGAEPHELDAAHDRALSEISRWAGPDPIDADTIVDRTIDEERQTIVWMRSGAKVVVSRSGIGTGPLWDRSDREEAISAWLESVPPPSL